MARRFFVMGALLALVGVGIGAFGAHGLRAHFAANPNLEATFQTASDYHLIHALALLGVAWAVERWNHRLLVWGGYLLVLGAILFSGSLYLFSIANMRAMGAVAPLGGLALLAGWACLALGVWRSN